MHLRVVVALLLSIASYGPMSAEQVEPYAVPYTADGHPNLQGVWATEFITGLERPRGVDALVVSPEQARLLAGTLRSGLPDLIDPEVFAMETTALARVEGEYRTSVIVEPADGRMPFTDAGEALSAAVFTRNTQAFDHYEQRPLFERCMENFGHPPMRALFAFLPHQILQTRDHVVIASEGAVSVRIIHLGEQSTVRGGAQC